MATRLKEIDVPCYNNDPPALQDFIDDIETYFVASNLSITDNSAQCAAILACQAGRQMRELLKINKPLIAQGEAENEYEYYKRIILSKELPKKNPTFESYQFRKIFQREGEPFQQFTMRLEAQVQRCEYEDRDRQLKDQIVIGCLSVNLRKVALREDASLAKLFDLGKSEEYAIESSETIGNNKNSYEASLQVKTKSSTSPQHYVPKENSMERKCFNCGLKWPHQDQCPAKGKSCSNCQKPNHFARVCRSAPKAVMQVQVTTENNKDSDENAASTNVLLDGEYLFHINRKLKENAINVCIDSNINVKFIPDTGASVTIIDYESFLRIKQIKHYPLFRDDTTKIYSYGSVAPLPLKGSFYAKLSYNGNQSIVKVFVLQKFRCGNLLCKKDCIKLKLLQFNQETACSVSSSQSYMSNDKIQQVLDNFPLSGIGQLKDFELKLQIDKNFIPVTQKSRLTPLSRRKFVEGNIQELLDNDIIEEVTDVGTTWLSPIHVVKREGNQ